MHIGVTFPQTEIGTDSAAIRDYVQAIEALGYEHLITYEHVLGINPAQYPGWNGPYTYKDTFHEPFVLFGYLAAVTPLELATAVIISVRPADTPGLRHGEEAGLPFLGLGQRG